MMIEVPLQCYVDTSTPGQIKVFKLSGKFTAALEYSLSRSDIFHVEVYIRATRDTS